MNKFKAHQPRVGIECTFYTSNGIPTFIGFFEHGGAHGKWTVTDSKTGKKYEDMEIIESWQYL